MSLASGLKKLSYFFVFIMILIISAFVALAFVVDKEAIKDQIISQVEASTGRQLSIKGELSFNFWPSIGVSVSDVALSNAKWSTSGNMFEINSLDIDLAVKPLIKKEVNINRFVLNKPKVILEVSKTGQQNWVFETPKKEKLQDGDKYQKSDKKADAASSSLTEMLSSFSVGEFAIKKARFVYIDHKSKQRQEITNLNTDIEMTSLTETLRIKGDLEYNKIPLAFEMTLNSLMSFIEDQKADVNAKLKLDNADLAFKGDLNLAQTNMVKGGVQIEIDNLNQLIKSINGTEANAPVKTLSLKGTVSAGAKKIALSSLKLNADDVQAEGKIAVTLLKIPSIVAQLKTNVIVLDRFMGTKSTEEDNQTSSQQTSNKQSGWDDTPIDLSGLKQANVMATLRTDGVVYKDLQTGPTQLDVTLQNGALDVKLSETRLASGLVSMVTRVDTRGAKPRLSLKAEMLGVKAHTVLAKLFDFKDLSGSAFVTVDVAAEGKSQKQMISTLNGKGKAVFKDGAIEGIDVVNMAQNIQGKMTEFGFYSQGRTEFVSTGGSYSILNGLLSNQDFVMEGPLVEAKGKGTVDLPKQYLNYRVTPQLVLSQSVENKTSLAIPVDIKGHWSNPKIKPDFKSVIAETLNNPEKIENSLKQMKEQFKGVEDQLKQNPDQAKELLKGLFGGF